MLNIKQINIKNHIYYFFTDMSNIKYFDYNFLKIDKTSCKNIDIYNIGYIWWKKNFDDYKNINSVNQLYPIIGKADGYIEGNNGNIYLVFTSTDGNKKVLAKFTKLWDETKHIIETKTEGKKSEYKKILWKSNLIQMIIYS